MDDKATADSLLAQNAINLYEPLRQDMDHVIMAVYATGDIGTISDYVPTDDGGETVDIGEEGGALHDAQRCDEPAGAAGSQSHRASGV